MQGKAIVSRAKAYLQARHQAVRAAMEQLKLGGLLLTTPADLSYLTDFTGDDSIGLITADRFYLVTDFRYREQAGSEAGWTELHVREGDMADTLAKVLIASKAERIGFEANGATVGQIKAVERALTTAAKSAKKSSNGVGSVELVPVEDVMLTLRKVKDDHEIALIRKSVATAEEAYNAVRGEIKVGQTEAYLAALLDFEMRCRGASAASFSPRIGSKLRPIRPVVLPP